MDLSTLVTATTIEAGIVAFASFFALIDPIGNAVMFASLTVHDSAKHRRNMAFKGVAIACILLLMFMFVGESLLTHLGISLAALRTAGGILLMILAIDMVFAIHSGGTSTTDEEEDEARQSDDISVFPLATPLIAGAGSISAVILLHANAQGDTMAEIAIMLALLLVMLITLVLLLIASQVQRVLGTTGLNVINRILGVILSALAVQFVFDGLLESGLIK
ncbi:MAG: MarC family protein [Cocleimonas sp.]